MADATADRIIEAAPIDADDLPAYAGRLFALLFAGYRAALDREERASRVHSEWADRLRALHG